MPSHFQIAHFFIKSIALFWSSIALLIRVCAHLLLLRFLNFVNIDNLAKNISVNLLTYQTVQWKGKVVLIVYLDNIDLELLILPVVLMYKVMLGFELL